MENVYLNKNLFNLFHGNYYVILSDVNLKDGEETWILKPEKGWINVNFNSNTHSTYFPYGKEIVATINFKLGNLPHGNIDVPNNKRIKSMECCLIEIDDSIDCYIGKVQTEPLLIN